MFIRSLLKCDAFIAGDNTLLRELFNPNSDALALRYSLAHATLKPGGTTTPHSLHSSEVYYILQGCGQMHINDEINAVQPGDAVYIPPESIQYITNHGTTDLVFLCMVDPAWRPEDETVLPE